MTLHEAKILEPSWTRVPSGSLLPFHLPNPQRNTVDCLKTRSQAASFLCKDHLARDFMCLMCFCNFKKHVNGIALCITYIITIWYSFRRSILRCRLTIWICCIHLFKNYWVPNVPLVAVNSAIFYDPHSLVFFGVQKVRWTPRELWGF